MEILGHFETNLLKVCSWAWKGGVCRFGFVKISIPISWIGKHPFSLSTWSATSLVNGETLEFLS